MADTRYWTHANLALLETMPDAILAVDRDGIIVYANRLIEEMFGYPTHVLVGQPVEALHPDEARDRHRRHLRDYGKAPAVRTMGGTEADLRGRHRNGHEFPVDISLSPVDTEDGPLVIASVRDMTERRRMERDLRRANERLRRDFDAAANIQTSLLPGRPAEVSGIAVDWVFEPCDRLGGDCFNVFTINERLVGFYLLDVTGHGVVAALQSVALARALSAAWPTPLASGVHTAEIVAHQLNERFPLEPGAWDYFTFLGGVIELSTLTVRFVSAGHPGPVRLPATGDPEVLQASGLPIGMFPGTEYTETVARLAPGDRLFCYSDGVTDAMNPADEDFNQTGLVAALAAARARPLAETLHDVRETVRTWRGGDALDDDLTLVGLEVPARGAGAG